MSLAANNLYANGKQSRTKNGKLYTLTVSLTGLNLVPKGRRKGYELAWVDLVSGDAAVATPLTVVTNWTAGLKK